MRRLAHLIGIQVLPAACGGMLLVAGWLTALPGCGGSRAPVPARVPPPPIVVAVQKPEVVDVEPPPTERIPAEPETPPVEPPAAVPGPPAFNPAAVERFVLFTPQLPLIVEVELLIDGQPHTQALAALIDEVLKVADTDGDGRVSWKEVTESKRFKYGQFGNLPFDRQNGPKQIIEQYDLDRDGVLDRDEAPRFLTRNAGSARPFSLRGTSDWRALNRRQSPTWHVLDADDDGVLSPADLAAAAARLRSRDQDDDDLLVAADFRATVSSMDMSRRPVRASNAGRLLGLHAAWDRIREEMERVYALDGKLRRENLPTAPELFELLDADSNGVISVKEYPRLNDAPPHVRISLAFGRSHDAADQSAVESPSDQPSDKAQVALQVVEISEVARSSGVKAELRGGRIILQVPAMQIVFAVNDTLSSSDFESQAKQSLAMYDADKNGYLEASEVPEAVQAQFGRFDAIDVDEDGKIYTGEIVAYLSHQQAALRAQIHAKAEDIQDAVFPLLDEDGDGRLVGKEIAGVGNRLLSFDANGDGQIEPDELPGEMLVVFARGSLENREQLFQPRAVAPPPASDAPKWFTRMDESGDGLISAREFLGEIEEFRKLDKNGDGFLDVTELDP